VRPSEQDTERINLFPPAPGEPVPAPARVRSSGRMRLGPWHGVAVLALVAVGIAGFVWAPWAAEADEVAGPNEGSIEVETAEVVKQDMTKSRSLPATLGYGTARVLKGSRDGVVTWLPKPGASVKRGKQLYRVDDRPVPLFYGGLPLFRTLGERNMVGRDVRVVIDNLKAMGYSVGDQPAVGAKVTQTAPQAADPAGGEATPPATGEPQSTVKGGQPADTKAAAPAPGPSKSSAPTTERVTVGKGESVLTARLIAAIKKWQKASGLPVTGKVEVGDLIVATGAVRVDSVTAQIGDSANGALMSVTPTVKVITVAAEPADADSIAQGDNVTVTLPDEKEAPGKVIAVGTALQAPEGSGGEAKPTLTVTVALDDAGAVSKLDSAAVQVDFEAETHAGVLAVPVGALTALQEGGYGVQLAEGGLVAVKTGFFVKGLVEVTGAGLAEGTRVVTTS